jgi:uncharacterized protein YgbK (DUF1537 family)
MTLQQLLSGRTSAETVARDRESIREHLRQGNTKLVVVDDDPTGTQTVQDVRVYFDWSVETLTRAMAGDDSVFYVSTNSRALEDAEMWKLTRELGVSLQAACAKTGKKVLLASRSDSTLRGHFPRELEALQEGLGFRADGVIIAPALFEAGRYTVDDVHWVDQAGEVVPASETEFARDPMFGYTKSNLREWVEEKTKGAWKADKVLSISLDALRKDRGKEALDILLSAKGGVPIVLNAACYEDIETAVSAIEQAELSGRRFLYRAAACFVKVRGGFQEKPLLAAADLKTRPGPGLVIVGSYVGKTTLQLENLLKAGRASPFVLAVEQLDSADIVEAETKRIAGLVDAAIRSGHTAVVYTSRTVQRKEGDNFLSFGNRIMAALCGIVQAVRERPAFLVAKGGITSIEVARTGLRAREAYVAGQIAKGVPLWELGPESKWPGMVYVVFPGNVGDESTLRAVVDCLRAMRGGD